MAHRSQCSDGGDNPLDPNYLPPHYREEYRLAIDALVEEDLEGYYTLLQKADVVDFLSSSEIDYIQSSVQLPEQSNQPELRSLEAGGDGSSDTYWPVHSDLDAPDLDLGWPQVHKFIGPTEVTTLVNPPEPDMPSIKEQARRLIKNAQQVIAIVMDTFTDVDIFADILNAAMRNVAVYILLDKENAHHFNNMVSNCRVDLQSMQFLRVRTVSGITYNCRSGKSLKGQMMDRFLLTDCRAVLSGNYSFMWSFEKLHRCMAHLFLGQLVSTFDEEFRILFALSQPMMFENVLAPMDNVSLLQKRQFPSDKTLMYREPRKFISLDTVHPDEWARHSYDERMDTESRMKPLRRNDSFHSPADLYSRYPSQQSYMDNPASKRHSYAEGVQGRYSFPFLQQQGIPEPEIQGRQFQRGQQPYPGPGKEADYSGYDKFWNQDFHSADQYSDPGLPPDRDPSGNYDPVLNYLSSTRNVDFDPDSENVPHAADLPFTSSHPQRLSLGQPYSCQTSPTPSNHSDQKQFFLEPNTDRKDPVVKRGLRNWRISSYLSANDNPGDEGLPLAPSNAPDAFEDTFKPMPQKAVGIDLPVPKLPNVREFKIPSIPRASQMPSYTKTTAREVPKRLPDELTAVAAETRMTPSPSESSSTTEGEKTEESEPKEPKTAVLQREDSFRRKYNVAIPRSSRLRSSLIFSSLDQDNKVASGQQDEESDKSDAPKTKQPFVSQILGQRRSKREPIEWSSFIKSATFDESATNPSKQLDEKNEADLKGLPEGLPENPVVQESFKPIDRESEPSAADLPKTDQTLFVDMSDPDNRLMIFKELAAKRKAAKAAEAEKNKAKAQMKPQTELIDNTTVKKEGPAPEETLEKLADTPTSEGFSEKRAIAEDAGKEVFTEPCKSVSQSSDASDKTNNEDSQVKHYCDTLPSCKEKQTRVSTDSEKMGSLTPGSVEIPQSSSFAALDSSSRNPESSQLEQCIPSPLLLSASDSVHSPAVTSEVSISTPASSSMLSPNAQETLSLSAPEPSQSLEETLQKSTTSSIGQTESDQLHSVSQLTSSESRLAVDSAHVKSDITPDTCAASLEPNISSLHSSTITDSEESCAFTTSGICKTEVLGQSKGVKANTTPTKVSALWPESCLPQVSDLKSKSRSDQNETITLDTSDENSPAETSSPLHPDWAPNPPGSETTASPQDTPTQVTTSSELDLTGPVTPTLAKTVSCSSPLTESAGLVLSPEAEKTLSALHSPSDTNALPMQVITDSNETPKLSSTGTSTTNEPTSKVPIEPDLPCRTPKSVISETHPTEPPVPAEMTGIDSQNEVSKNPEMPDCGEKAMDDMEATHNVNDTTTQESVCSEKTNDQVGQKDCSELPEIISDEVVPPSPQSKLPKSGQSRYQSSTANVISSSNLRDDTKLLLEQISANSQIRNEAAKESPVTDDEKEDEADKHAIREKEREIKSLSRGKPKSNPEREKLLERIQTMRKDRKVYSRFEMAP